MSIHVSSWAWKQQVGDEGAKLVLLKLADQANDDGVAWAKRAVLQAETEAGHIDTVTRRLRRLRDLELAFAVPWFTDRGARAPSMFVLPYKGMPSSRELAEALAAADRVGVADGMVVAELAAVEVVCSFVHTCGFGCGKGCGEAGGYSASAPGGTRRGRLGGLGVGAWSTEPSVDPSFEPSSKAVVVVGDVERAIPATEQPSIFQIPDLLEAMP